MLSSCLDKPLSGKSLNSARMSLRVVSRRGSLCVSWGGSYLSRSKQDQNSKWIFFLCVSECTGPWGLFAGLCSLLAASFSLQAQTKCQPKSHCEKLRGFSAA